MTLLILLHFPRAMFGRGARMAYSCFIKAMAFFLVAVLMAGPAAAETLQRRLHDWRNDSYTHGC